MDRLIDPLLEDIAANFWEDAGGRAHVPVDLARAVALTLPLDIVSLSSLSTDKVRQWLSEREIAYGFDYVDCPLYGLLVVYRGSGFIFVDGADDERTRRFTLAHEAAHFLIDYRHPRRKAVQRLGGNVLDILDGRRVATDTEQLAGVLTGVDIAPHVHLLTRVSDGAAWSMRVSQAEERADQLAFELLAPAYDVANALREAGASTKYATCVETASSLLQMRYELPEELAEAYARRLARAITGGPSLLSALALD